MNNETAYIRTGADVSVNLAKGLFDKSPSSPKPPKDDFDVVTTAELWNLYNTTYPVLFWGKDNRYPFQLDEASKLVGILKKGLNRLVSYAYNQGIFAYEEIEAPDPTTGTQKIKILQDAKFDAFCQYSRVHDYLLRSFRDYFDKGINYPVYLLSADRKVAQLRTYGASEVRLNRPNPDTGIIEKIWVSKFWNIGAMPTLLEDDVRFLSLPLLDDYNLFDELQYGKEFTYAQRVRDFMHSDEEYGGADWHSVYHNQWLNISSSVPQLKARLFQYAMTINYMIYIDDNYWTTVFGKGFKDWTPEKKAEKVKELQDSIERDLVGKDQGFKSLFASIKYSVEGKEQKSIIIQAIDNKLREGTFIPDNLHANGEILTALGLDGCLVGASVLGEKISSGSGSNIREAALNLISTMRPVRDLQLEPLYVVKQINGWNPKMKFGFKDYIIGTQDGRPPVNGNSTPQA